jgi:hypothetical protein
LRNRKKFSNYSNNQISDEERQKLAEKLDKDLEEHFR